MQPAPVKAGRADATERASGGPSAVSSVVGHRPLPGLDIGDSARSREAIVRTSRVPCITREGALDSELFVASLHRGAVRCGEEQLPAQVRLIRSENPVIPILAVLTLPSWCCSGE